MTSVPSSTLLLPAGLPLMLIALALPSILVTAQYIMFSSTALVILNPNPFIPRNEISRSPTPRRFDLLKFN